MSLRRAIPYGATRAYGGICHVLSWLEGPGVVKHIGDGIRVTLGAWENIAGGLYRAAILPVRQAGSRRPALIYLARTQAEAPPQAGYMDVVIAAALEWQLPAHYIEELQAWSLRGPQRVKAFRWT